MSPVHGSRAYVTVERRQRSRGRPVGVFIGVIAYLVIFRYTYESLLVPTFSYLGYGTREVDGPAYVLTLMFVAALGLFLPPEVKRPSDFMLWTSFLLINAPTMAAAQFAEFIHPSEVARFTLIVGLCTGLATVLVRHGPTFNLSLRVEAPVTILVLAVISTATFGYLAATTGLQIRFTSLTEVLNLRLEYRNQASGSILGYLIPTQVYAVNPAIMAWGLYRRLPLVFIFGAFLQLLLYSVGGHRIAILSPLAILGLFFVFRQSRDLRPLHVIYGLTGLLVLHVLLASFELAAHFGLMVQRLVIFPPALATATVEFFRVQEKTYWAYSFMSPFIDYPYATTPNFLVGAWMGIPANSANSNFIADGFSNFGYVGVLIEVLVFVVLLWLLDAALKDLPMPVVCSVLVLPAIALANVSAFTVILSQGVGAAIIVGAFMPRGGWHVHKRRLTARGRGTG